MLLQSCSGFRDLFPFYWTFYHNSVSQKSVVYGGQVPWRSRVAWWEAVGSGGDQGAGGHVPHLKRLPFCHPSQYFHVGL